jgi:hypothetical protein
MAFGKSHFHFLVYSNTDRDFIHSSFRKQFAASNSKINKKNRVDIRLGEGNGN